MIEEGQSREEIINAGFNEKDVYKVYNLVLKKRIQTLPVVSDAAVVDLYVTHQPSASANQQIRLLIDPGRKRRERDYHTSGKSYEGHGRNGRSEDSGRKRMCVLSGQEQMRNGESREKLLVVETPKPLFFEEGKFVEVHTDQVMALKAVFSLTLPFLLVLTALLILLQNRFPRSRGRNGFALHTRNILPGFVPVQVETVERDCFKIKS